MLDIKAVYIDMDGTAVCYETGDFHSSWDALGHSLCDVAAWDRGTSQFYDKPHLYETWIHYNARLLAGKTVDAAWNALRPENQIPYTKGFTNFCRRARETMKVGIVSSGVGLVARWIVEENQLSFSIGNELEIVDGVFTGNAFTNVPLWKKADIVAERALQDGVQLDQVCFIGDNENDLPVMERVGLPVYFVPKPNKWELAQSLKQRTKTEAHIYIINDFAQLDSILWK